MWHRRVTLGKSDLLGYTWGRLFVPIPNPRRHDAQLQSYTTDESIAAELAP